MQDWNLCIIHYTHKYLSSMHHRIPFLQHRLLVPTLHQKYPNYLYQIAVSDNCQLERQYDADKIKYAIRNILSVLSSVKYTELEDTINKIIDVHTHLKKKDRYEYHRNLNATEYKKKIMAIIDQKLDVILLNKSDMLYHTVAQQLQKNLKDMYIETTNRSTSQLIIANRDRKIEELTNSEE